MNHGRQPGVYRRDCRCAHEIYKNTDGIRSQEYPAHWICLINYEITLRKGVPAEHLHKMCLRSI